jgi:tetratricopeptide (TPR) repeat protein
VSTISTLERELAPHLPAVWARFLAKHHGIDQDSRRALINLVKEDVPYDSFGEIVQRIVELSSGISLPLLPVALKTLQRTVSGVRAANEIRGKLRTESVVKDPYSETRETFDPLLHDLKRIARPGLPIIIALDNLEFQHPSFYTFLDDLLPALRSDDGPILVVATVSTKALDRWPAPLSEMMAWLEDRHRITMLQVPPMRNELDGFFSYVAPKTDEATRRLITRHHPTPLRLWAFLNSPDARDHIVNYQLNVGEELLHRMPMPSDIIRTRPWTSLSPSAQGVLSLMAAVSMKEQGVGDLLVCPKSALTELARLILPDISEQELSQIMADGTEICQKSDGTVTFTDLTVSDIATAEGRRRFAGLSHTIRDAIIDVMATIVEKEDFPSCAAAIKYLSAYAAKDLYGDGSTAAEIHVKRLLVATYLHDYDDVEAVIRIFSEKGWPEDEQLSRVARESIFNYLIERQRVNEAFRFGLQIIRETGGSRQDNSDSNSFDLSMAHLIGLNGQPELAVEALENLLRRAKAAAHDDSAIRSCLGMWLMNAGRPADAVSVLEPLVQSLADLDLRDDESLAVQENYASALARDDRQAEARALFDQLLEDSRRYRGANHPLTLRLEQNRLALLSTELPPEERVSGLGDLLRRRIEYFGYDEGSLATWVTLLNTLGQLDRHLELIDVAIALIEEFTDAFSELHEQIITAVILLGWNLVYAGRNMEGEVWALNAFRRVEQCRLPHPWQVRAVTLLLARCAVERGDWLSARNFFLPIRLESVAANAPSVELADMWIRLALCMADNGQILSAAQELDSMLAWPVILPILSGETQVNMHRRAGEWMLGTSLDQRDSYWLTRAIWHLQKSAATAAELALAPAAFEANRRLVIALRRIGRSDEAIDLCKRLLRTSLPDTPVTVIRDLKEELLYCLMDGDLLRDAIVLGEELIGTSEASSSDAEGLRGFLRIRHNVAVCRYLTGDVSRAREEMRSVALDRERHLGKEDAETVLSRDQLSKIETSFRNE